MDRSSSRYWMGLRPRYQAGLAFVLVGLIVNLALMLTRTPPAPVLPPARAPGPIDRSVVVRITEKPPMVIDPVERERAGDERSDNLLEMRFCWCPPGEFFMAGGPKHRSYDLYLGLSEAPFRLVLGRGFWMGKFEVTQAEWLRVMGKTLNQQRAMDPNQPRPLGDRSRRDHAGIGPDYPIYFTSYNDAQEFCYRLTRAERDAGRLETGWVYRLPTEAEWEYACCAGTTTATAFGDRLDSTQANFDGTVPFNRASPGPFIHLTRPVGSYPANAWGIHDMHGNVWEWCRDVDPPTIVGGKNPLRSVSPLRRTIRGGCWYEKGHDCLSTTRLRLHVDGRGSGLGFRVALVSTELWRLAGDRP